MKQEKNMTTRALATIGKLTVFAVLFPYQITVNRKEGSFGVRSIGVGVKFKRKMNEKGVRSTDVTLSLPGFAVGEAKKKLDERLQHKKKKKHLKRKHKEKIEIHHEDDEE